MKKILITLLLLSVFMVVSCNGGTKKDTDKDLGTTDTDVITDVEMTDDDFPLTDDDSLLTDYDLVTDDSLPVTDNDEEPDEFTDDSEEPDDAFTPEEYTVDGFVQKGPFIKDSSIKITELDNNFEMIPATTFTTKTIDDVGNFNVKRKFGSRYIEIEASGYYYNEVAGTVSSSTITNFVFVDLKANNSKISINILTTLARKRIQYLMKQGKNFNAAREQAEKEVLEIFGIFGEPAANFQDMDILKAGNSNAMLLAISARLQGGNTPGELSVNTAGIIYEIEETGKVTNDALKNKIAEGTEYIKSKYSDLRNNLETYFSDKTTVEVPNFENYCDDNGNGIINKWDFDLDFAPKEKAERNTAYTSEEKTVKVNPATTAVAKTTAGTIVINGTDTGLSESPISDGDKLSVKVVSSNEFKTTVKADVTVEFTVNEGGIDDWTVSGSYSVTTGECDSGNDRTCENCCGINNRGSCPQLCVNEKWEYAGECEDPDVCVDKNINISDTTVEVCVEGHWQYQRDTSKQWGSNYADYGASVAVDSNDNIYVTGITEGNLDGNTSAGSYDIFITKWGANGTKQWTKQWGTSEFDVGNSIAVDSDDNIYVTGMIQGNLDGNAHEGGEDIFLTKWSADGTKQWTKQWGTSGDDQGRSVTVDSNDNIYVTGTTKGYLDGNTNAGDSDIFITKWSNDGTKQWTKQWGTPNIDYGFSIAVDSNDNIYVTGETQGGLDGNTNAGEDCEYSCADIFLTKWSSDGTKQWTMQWGIFEEDMGVSVSVDSNNNIYVTGTTQGDLDGNTNAREVGEYWLSKDVFLTKWSSDGTKQWTKQWGTSGDDQGSSVTVDSNDNIYVTGTTKRGLDGNTNAGGQDIFLTKW